MPTLEYNRSKAAAVDAVTRKAVALIRSDASFARLSAFSEEALSAWCAAAIFGLALQPSGADPRTVERVFYELGRTGATQRVPLAELVRALTLVLDLGRRRRYAGESGRSFLSLTRSARYYLIRGYEDAIR